MKKLLIKVSTFMLTIIVSTVFILVFKSYNIERKQILSKELKTSNDLYTTLHDLSNNFTTMVNQDDFGRVNINYSDKNGISVGIPLTERFSIVDLGISIIIGYILEEILKSKTTSSKEINLEIQKESFA